MESLIRLKKEWLDTLSGMLAPGEELIIAVPCGGHNANDERYKKAHDFDYLLITAKRIMYVKGKFFLDKSGFTAFPRKLCSGVTTKPYLMGCNVKISFTNPVKKEEEIILEAKNCRKKDAEAIEEELNRTLSFGKCPSCRTELQKPSTFCPKCGRVLRKICPTCGKEICADMTTCPRCSSTN